MCVTAKARYFSFHMDKRRTSLWVKNHASLNKNASNTVYIIHFIYTAAYDKYANMRKGRAIW